MESAPVTVYDQVNVRLIDFEVVALLVSVVLSLTEPRFDTVRVRDIVRALTESACDKVVDNVRLKDNCPEVL